MSDRTTSIPAMTATIAESGDGRRYFGSKTAAGVWQSIINQIPPHQNFVELFAGMANITKRKLPCASSIAVDSDAAVITLLKRELLSVPNAYALRDDAIEWLTLWTKNNGGGNPKTVIYLDPPYLFECRSSRRARYHHEFGTIHHHMHLLGAVNLVKSPVLLSHPRHEMYEQMLPGWRRVEFPAMTRGGIRTETLWCNFPQPTELHDYRFAGVDYRERERIKRKRQRWIKRLAKMSALDRSVILDAILDLAPSEMTMKA